MSDTRQKRFIGHIHDRADAGSGVGVFTTFGYLTDCGGWVEQTFESLDKQRMNTVRHALDRHWCETPRQAEAMLADRIRAIGRRLLQQADELEAAARDEAAAGS